MPPQLRKQLKAKDEQRRLKVETRQQSNALEQLSSTYGFEFDLEDGSTDHLDLNLDLDLGLALDLGRFQDHLERGGIESPDAASDAEAGAAGVGAKAEDGEEDDPELALELEMEMEMGGGAGDRDDAILNELRSPTPNRSPPPPELFQGEQQWTQAVSPPQKRETSSNSSSPVVSPVGRLDLSWDDSFVRALVTGTLNSMRSDEEEAEAGCETWGGGDDESSAFSLTAAPETGSPRFAAAASDASHKGRSSPSSVSFHPDASTFDGSTISYDGSIFSRTSSLSRRSCASSKPSLILPKLLVVLEELYIASATQRRSLFARPKWGGAGAATRKRKEEDAKWLAETAPR